MHFEIRSGKHAGKRADGWQWMADVAALHFANPDAEPLVADMAGLLLSRPNEMIRVTFEILDQPQHGAQQNLLSVGSQRSGL